MNTHGFRFFPRLRRWWPAVLLALGTHSGAADLMDAWRQAQAHDPQLAVAQAQRAQAQARLAQVAPLWEPQAQARVAAGVGGQDAAITNARAMGQSGVDFDSSILAGAMVRTSVGVQKPLRNASLDVQARMLEVGAGVGDLQWKQAEQDLAWRVVQRYIEVLSARLTQESWQRQLQTMVKAEAEIVRRQRVGDATKMDVQEAQARLASVRAQLVQARHEVDAKSLAYRYLTGRAPDALRAPADPRDVGVAALPDEIQWLNQARAQSVALQLVDLQIELQTQEARRIRVTGTTPTLDWVAQAQLDRLTGRGMGGGATQQIGGYLVGVQWTMPLGTHGLADAREQEAMKQVDKLRRDRDLAQSQIELQVSQAWQSLQAAQERVSVLAQANQVNVQRLAATRAAHQVGTRTTLEWLGAEQDAAQAELVWRQARLQVLLARARLHWASGQLGDTELQAINQTLQ